MFGSLAESGTTKNGMRYPIVVDDARGSITQQYREYGVVSYPTYMLLAPDGTILLNDQTGDGGSLRKNKLEMIYQVLREH